MDRLEHDPARRLSWTRAQGRDRPLGVARPLRERPRGPGSTIAAVVALAAVAVCAGLLAPGGDHPSPGVPDYRPPVKVSTVTDDSGKHLVITPHLPLARDGAVMSVAGSPRGYLLLGKPTTGGRMRVWVSPDGQSWSRTSAVHGLAGARLQDVSSIGSTFVAAGATRSHEPAVWTSPNGLDWNRATVASRSPHRRFDTMLGVTSSPEGMVAWGRVKAGGFTGDGYLWRSADGRRWVPVAREATFARPTPNGRTSVWAVTFADDQWSALGQVQPHPRSGRGEYAALWVSADGAHWQRASPGGKSGGQVVVPGSTDRTHAEAHGPAGRLRPTISGGHLVLLLWPST